MFEIHMGNAVVGSADVKRNGLYYHINCTCKPPSKEIHRVIMHDGSVQKDLGICVPTGNAFTLSARIPVKCFQGDGFTFQLVKIGKREIIVSSNMPFTHLDELESARLQHTNGQAVILIDSAPDPQDSGQIQEYQNR